MKRLFLFSLILLPIMEIVFLIKIGHWIGGWLTFFLLIGIGIAGVYLIQRQGLRVWHRIQLELEMGRMPTDALWDGLCILLAGIFLVVPGFLTDILALMLLLPGIRLLCKRFLQVWVGEKILRGTWHFYKRR